MSQFEEYLKVEDVAERLGLSTGSVYKAIRGHLRGTTALPAIRIGRRKIIRLESLEKWILENEKPIETLAE